MSGKEKISLAVGIGFFIIWVMDLNSPIPENIRGDFWAELNYHYFWLMFCISALFVYQYFRQMRIAKDKNSRKEQEKRFNKKRSKK